MADDMMIEIKVNLLFTKFKKKSRSKLFLNYSIPIAENLYSGSWRNDDNTKTSELRPYKIEHRLGVLALPWG